MKKLLVADLLCGGGGAGEGMLNAFLKHGFDYEFIGVNHWQIAIDTNKLNHEKGRYIKDSVEKVSPRELVPDGHLDYMWASPECTNHSRAKGGRARDDQSRSTAWHVLKWIQELIVDRLYIENVEEFLEWGPLDDDGNIIKSKKGEIFKKFILIIKAFGYRVEWRILNAADYGAPTCRRRLIIQAVRKGKISWPEPTHVKEPGLLAGLYKQWVPARDIIDWDIPGKSIFDRKKPLVPNTLRRIYSGIIKYWGEAAYFYAPIVMREIVRSCKHYKKCPFFYLSQLPKIKSSGITEPFIIIMRGTAAEQDSPSCKTIKEPVPSISTRTHAAIIESFITRYNGGDNRHSQINAPVPVQDCSNRYGIAQPLVVTLRGTSKTHINGTCKLDSEPVRTIAANGTHVGIVEPCVFAMGHTSAKDRASGINDPISTIVTKAEHCVIEPVIVAHKFNNKPTSVSNAIQTITTVNAFSIAEPVIVDMTHTGEFKGRVKNTSKPIGTITTRNNIAIAEALFIPQHGGGSVKSVSNPLSTIATAGAISQIEPFIAKYYSNGTAESINEPLDTVVCKDRFGLCSGRIFIDANGNIFKLDILFRMLQSHELAAAMSFRKDYKFAGNKADQVKQIGNAVPPKLAEALINASLSA